RSPTATKCTASPCSTRSSNRLGTGRSSASRRNCNTMAPMQKPVALLALAALATWASHCFPQAGAPNFPARPVRMLVGFTPGGGTDIIARLVAQKLGERWGQPVVVENRAGAGGNIATEQTAKAAPDGHTLLMAFSSHASNPALYGKLPFDINRD